MNELMHCCACGHEWRDAPGAWGAQFIGCPRCGSLYWQWATYKASTPCSSGITAIATPQPT
jgi:predicted  nucleic acid-binding Zn-ribbon protein